MDYIENWDKIRSRYAAFWRGQREGACLFAVTAPKEGARWEDFPLPDNPEDRLKWWTDPELVIKRHRSWFANTYYAGDAFPLLIHDLGPAGHAGFFEGARPTFEGTVWFAPTLERYEDLRFDPGSFLYQQTLSLCREYVRDAKGAYIVAMPDTVGDADALSHLRGPDQLMLDLLDRPEEVRAALAAVQAVWEDVMGRVFDLVLENNDGGSCVGWLSAYAPGRLGQLQCDLSVMVSPGMFQEFLVYELERQSEYLDHALYHLDGRQQVVHLPHILSVPGIRAVQWTNVAGQGPATDYIPVLRRIQAAGKGLILDCAPGEVPALLDQLSASGLFLRTWADSPAQAEDLVKLVAKLSRD
jgi:hypothetical protein